MTGKTTPKSRILGTGHYTPAKVVTNHDLEKVVETSDAWIQERTGIRRRRVVETTEMFDEMQIRTVRMSGPVQPRSIVETDSVDDERIAVPGRDRMAHPGRPGCCPPGDVARHEGSRSPRQRSRLGP